MRIAPDQLKPHPRNTRKHSVSQIARLKESLTEFGFVRPIVIDEENTILAGHGIWQAASELGMECEVAPVTGLTDEQKRAYVLLDNRLGELSSWDHEMLSAELLALSKYEFKACDIASLFLKKNGTRTNVEIGGDRFLLQIELRTEKELQELFEECQQRGLECKILS